VSVADSHDHSKHASGLRLTRTRALVLGLCAYLLLYLSWQLLHWLPGKQQLGQSFLIPMDLAALGASWSAARRTEGSHELRSFWLVMSAAMAAETIADGLLLSNDIRYDTAPFPTLADPFFLAFYVLLFIALLRVPVVRGSLMRRARLVLDGATIVLGGGAVVWYVVLGPTAQVQGRGSLATAVSLAYPIGDLILLTGVAAVLLRRAPAIMRAPLLLIAAGVLVSITADIVYGSGVLHGTYTGGDPIDTLYVLEFAAFALAAIAQQSVGPGDQWALRNRWRQPIDRANWLPYITAPIGFGLLVAVNWNKPFFPELSLVLIVMVIGGLVAARQYLALRELAKAEAAFRASERRFRAIFDNAGVGITFSEIDGPLIIDVNQAYAEMVGYPVEELRGGDFSTVIHPDELELYNSLTPLTLDGFQHETRYVHRDGTIFWGHLTLSVLHDETEPPRYVIGVLEDINQRKQAEQIKDEFISVVGHELRTPLTSIRGSLGLLEGGVLGELPREAAGMLTLAITNTDRLVRLINDILDIERMDAGRIEVELEPVRASELVRQAIDVIQVTATTAKVMLRRDLEELTVSADADRIVQALVNLLGNAVKFSSRDSEVTISVRAEHGRALFSVKDNGRGIPADRLETIFERFRQVDSSDSREKGGTGLGLTIARGIVEHHGGRLWAESEEGHGSTFRFTLPLFNSGLTLLMCGGGDHQHGGVEGRLAELRAMAPVLGSGGVLVVEDDPSLGEVLIGVFDKKGIDTQLVRTAQDAVEAIRRTQPSILLLDLMLPGEDGFTVVERLRGDGLLGEIPVLVYTALDLSPGDRERLQLGHTEFLSKANTTPQDIERRVSELVAVRGSHTA
jgi:PAS domain S-box-containing protein